MNQLQLPYLTPGATRESTLERCKEIARKAGAVKIVDIMRALPCGYGTAARLVDELIEQGFCEAIYHPGYKHGGRRLIGPEDASPIEH